MALGPQAEMFSWGHLALEGDSIGSSLLGLQVLRCWGPALPGRRASTVTGFCQQNVYLLSC